VIAHPFPPAGGGGVQRTCKLVKYLPAFGWSPVVLTTQAGLYRRRFGLEDRSLAAEIPPSVEIVRVPSPEAWTVSRLLRRVATWSWLPDRARPWNRVAIAVALVLCSRRRFDAIYATGDPFSSFLLARMIGCLSRTPYVIDFRDSWMLRTVRRPLATDLERECARLERLALESAARVVFATEPMEQAYRAVHPTLPGRTRVVLNGFDTADFEEALDLEPRPSREDPVVFLYAGTLNSYVRPDGLFAGLAIARGREARIANRLRLRFVGQFGTSPEERRAHRSSLEQHGLEHATEVEPYRPHSEVVRLQRTADVLVLITSGQREEQCAKTAEYLAAQRPILGLVTEGTPADGLLHHAGRVERARPDDPPGIARAIQRLFAEADRARPGERLPAAPASLDWLSRRHAAGQIAGVLAEAASERRLGPREFRWRDL